MSAILIKNKREDLFREITGILRNWPDLERKIFAQAHYYGQSPESISSLLEVDIKIVARILSKCERELLSSLRSFRSGGEYEAAPLDDAAVGPIARNRFNRQSRSA